MKKFKKLLAGFMTLAMLVTMLPATVLAEDSTVATVNGTPYTSLADAIDAADTGDTVQITAGTYAVPGMKPGITLEGEVDENGEPVVLLEGTLKGALKNLTLKNLHIKGSNAQRWAYAEGDLVFENVTFEATSVYALHFDGISEGTNLTYKDCTIIGWAAMGGSPASCVFDGCTIKGNGTYGVIRTYFDATIKNCTFDVANVNTTDVYQDGIHAVDATVTVENCTNVNGDMMDVLNISGTGKIKLGGKQVLPVVVAEVDGVPYASLQAALDAAVVAGDTVTVELLDDITLTEAWTPVYFNSYTAANTNTLIVNGNNHTITGLDNCLFSGTWTGNKLEINDLTIADSIIENDKDDSTENVGAGAFIGNVSATEEVVLNNCHLKNSSVEGGHWTGGLIGYAAGYSDQNNGPVFTTVTVKDCSVTDSTITGKGSVGAVVGHATGDAWTKFEIINTTIEGTTITGADGKTGVVMGTIGAAGQEAYGKTGGVFVDVTESDNTVNNGDIVTVYGRQGTSTGVLTITGGNATVYTADIDKFVFIADGLEKAENVKQDETTTITEPDTSTSSNKKSKKYDVIIKSSDNGDVEVDDDYAKRGQEITITVDPDKGYELDELTITDQNGDEVDYDKGSKDNTFVFDMPKSDVTIEASFEKVSSSSSDKDEDKEDAADEDQDVSAADEETVLILTINQVIYQLNGNYAANDVAPIIRGERTMLPIRLVAETLGATVTWNEAEQSVTIVNGDTEIVIYIGQSFALVNGEPVQLDAPAFIANDRTYLPVRFVAENLGATVTWDADAQTVTIVA